MHLRRQFLSSKFIPTIYLCTAVLGACANDNAAVRSFETTDSSGVSIVTNHGPAWGARDNWRIASEPSLVIGEMDGPPEYTFFRPSSAISFANGNIAVGNTGTNEIRFYDSIGTYIKAYGGTGGGPNEFQGLTWISRTSDRELIAYDLRSSRLASLDQEGEHLRDATLNHGQRILLPSLIAGVGDGRIFVQYTQRPEIGSDIELASMRDTLLTVAFDPSGQQLNRLKAWPNNILDVAERELPGRDNMVVPISIHFGPSATGQINGGFLYLGSTDRFQIDVFDLEGQHLRSMRIDTTAARVSDEHVAAMLQRVEDAVRGTNAFGQQQLEWLQETPASSELPLFGRQPFLVDPDGNLWVLGFNPENEFPLSLHLFSPNGSWPTAFVFDPSGVFLGQVAFPGRFRPTEVGTDYILGIGQDESDAKFVARYRLMR